MPVAAAPGRWVGSTRVPGLILPCATQKGSGGQRVAAPHGGGPEATWVLAGRVASAPPFPTAATCGCIALRAAESLVFPCVQGRDFCRAVPAEQYRVIKSPAFPACRGTKSLFFKEAAICSRLLPDGCDRRPDRGVSCGVRGGGEAVLPSAALRARGKGLCGVLLAVGTSVSPGRWLSSQGHCVFGFPCGQGVCSPTCWQLCRHGEPCLAPGDVWEPLPGEAVLVPPASPSWHGLCLRSFHSSAPRKSRE